MLDRMLPYLTACYGNPHSRTHAYGWESEAATERARRVSAGRGAELRGAPRCAAVRSEGRWLRWMPRWNGPPAGLGRSATRSWKRDGEFIACHSASNLPFFLHSKLQI